MGMPSVAVSESVLQSIGNTPVVRLRRVVPDVSADVVVKLEFFNPTGSYWTDQFHNMDAIDGYAGIGRELLEQVGTPIDAYCGAVGTGGMLRGVARAFREAGSRARIIALEPSTSPALTEGRGGPHRVEGIGTGRVVPHMSDKPYDEARAIDEEEARAMALRLAREEGLLVGTSSALNIAAALQVARELGPGKIVTTVAVDTGLKYLAGDLFGG